MSYYQTIYNRLRAAGLTEAGALGMLGNFDCESNCEPNRLQGDFSPYRSASKQYVYDVTSGRIDQDRFSNDKKGFGLYQLTLPTRKRGYYDFWKESGKALDDAELQCDYAIKEMPSESPGLLDELKTSNDLYQCIKDICVRFERPAVNNIDARFQAAKNIRSQLDLTGWESGSSEAETEEKGNAMTKDEAVKKVLDIARGEIGYHEQGDNWTKYAAEMDKTNWYNGGKNGFAWCDVFYDWLFYKAFGDPLGREMICQPAGSAGAGCLFSAQYYQQAGRWFTTPQPGDQIFFSYAAGEYSHTGIVEAVNGGQVVTIEGNTSDRVERRIYDAGNGSIAGYGRPCWAIVEGANEQAPETPKQDAILYKGMMKNASVKAMQAMLMDLGYDLGKWKDDGDYGNDTFRAVAEFQEDHGLPVTGSVNQKTLDAIKAAWKGIEQPPDDPPPEDNTEHHMILSELSYGSRGDQAALLQTALNLCGFPCGKADGEVGPKTQAALNAFKEYKGLKPDGKADKDTWTLLLMWRWAE